MEHVALFLQNSGEACDKIVSDRCIGTVVGEREEMRELAVVQGIEVHLAMLHIVFSSRPSGSTRCAIAARMVW